MIVLLDNVLSFLVYIGSFLVFTIAINHYGKGLERWLRIFLILLSGLFIFVIARFELPPSGLPFWSRDFSLTWQLLVLSIAVVAISARLILSLIDELLDTNLTLKFDRWIYYDQLTVNQKLEDDPVDPEGGVGQPPLTLFGGFQRNRHIFQIFIGALLLLAYIKGAVSQLVEVNHDITAADQRSYMQYAQKMAISEYSHVGDRNRMPVYPFIQSLLYSEDFDENDFFEHGKYVNLILSILILIGIGFLFNKYLGPLWTIPLMLITAFTVFIFKAGWFQAELLFYFLNFVLFILMLEYLRNPGFTLAVWLGILAGYVHLTKASVLPGFVLFLIVMLFMLARQKYFGRRHRERKLVFRSGGIRGVVQLFIAIIFFFLVIFPYIKNSWYRFDSPLYNVNSTFYMWYDSWGEAKAGTRAHGDRVGWPEMPDDEIPSITKYLADHSFKEIINRLTNGMKVVYGRVSQSYGYLKYIVILSFAALFGILVRFDRVKDEWDDKSGRLIFVFIYFSMYFLLYFWYTPIASGNRLILAQFLPLVFVLAITIIVLLQDKVIRLGKDVFDFATLIALLLIIVIGVDIWFVLTDRISQFGGA